jgi:hypothetical protein
MIAPRAEGDCPLPSPYIDQLEHLFLVGKVRPESNEAVVVGKRSILFEEMIC